MRIDDVGNLPWEDDGYVDGRGQGFHVSVAWCPDRITCVAVTEEEPLYDRELVEDPELDDGEIGRLKREILASDQVLDVLSVEELEVRIGFQLPVTVREAL